MGAVSRGDINPLPNWAFRTLNAHEEAEFREYARKNDPKDWASWCLSHPVCRDEWTKLGKAVEPPMWVCAICHTANGDGDKHCVGCGRKRI